MITTKNSRMPAILALIILFTSGCNSKTDSNVDDDIAAINDIWVSYSSSLIDGDIDAWLSLWTEDGVQMPPGEAPVIGMEQLRQRNGGALELFTVEMAIDNQEIGVAGVLAFSRGVYTATFSPKDGSQPIPVDGKFMTILKRQPDGSWKIHRDIFNSNVAPAGN